MLHEPDVRTGGSVVLTLVRTSRLSVIETIKPISFGAIAWVLTTGCEM